VKKGGVGPVFDADHLPRFEVVAPDPRRAVHPSLGRNRCVEDVYEPGSTFKPFVWSALVELGLVRLDEVIDTEGGFWRTSYGRSIEDVTRRDEMTWREVLTNSSNIGMVKVGERATGPQIRGAIVRFGFGKRTGIGLPGEAAGLLTSERDWTRYTHTSVCFGYEVAVTPIQMARAFSAFARSGELAGTLPTVRLASDGAAVEAEREVVERVLPSWVAAAAREPMAGTAAKMEGQMARVFPEEPGKDGAWKYRMFGKSGTSKVAFGSAPPGYLRPKGLPAYARRQYNSSFVAAGPAEDPRLVVLVVIDDPGPSLRERRLHYGSGVAGPVVRRVMERCLEYLGTPASRPTRLVGGGAAVPTDRAG